MPAPEAKDVKLDALKERRSSSDANECWRTSSVHLVSVRSGSTSRESIESVMTSASPISDLASNPDLDVRDKIDEESESVSSGEFEQNLEDEALELEISKAISGSLIQNCLFLISLVFDCSLMFAEATLRTRTKESLHVASSREFVHKRDQESDEDASSLDDISDFIITPIDTPLGACSTTSTETNSRDKDGTQELDSYLDLLKESVTAKRKGRHLPGDRPIESAGLERLDSNFLTTIQGMVDTIKGRADLEDVESSLALLKDSEDECSINKDDGLDGEFISTINDIVDGVKDGQANYENISSSEEDDVVLERLTALGPRTERFSETNSQFVSEKAQSEPISEEVMENMDKAFAKTIQGMFGQIKTQTADDGDDAFQQGDQRRPRHHGPDSGSRPQRHPAADQGADSRERDRLGGRHRHADQDRGEPFLFQGFGGPGEHSH